MPVANRDGEATSGPPHGDSPHFTVHRGLYSLPVGIELPFLQIQRFIQLGLGLGLGLELGLGLGY